MTKPVRKAIFPVAGQGTRFLPATKAMPKEMLPVVDKPLIQYAVEEAREAGIEEFIFVTGRAKSAIEDHFDYSFELEHSLEEQNKIEILEVVRELIPKAGKVFYTRQQKPLGLGHAVWCARYHIQNEPFAVLLADDLVLAKTGCLTQMMSAHHKFGGNLVAVEDVAQEQTNRYGILDVIDENGTIVQAKGLVEKPEPEDTPSTLAIIGRYILQPEVLEYLDRQEKGANGEIQLTDAIAYSLDKMPLHGQRFEGVRYDCGNQLGFLEANIAFSLDREHMRDGVKAILKKYK